MLSYQYVNFSQYWREADKKAIIDIHNQMSVSKYYQSIQDEWKKPLEKKRIKRQKKLENPVVPKPEDPNPSLYVHDPE
jgi:hypothetical protein